MADTKLPQTFFWSMNNSEGGVKSHKGSWMDLWEERGRHLAPHKGQWEVETGESQWVNIMNTYLCKQSSKTLSEKLSLSSCLPASLLWKQGTERGSSIQVFIHWQVTEDQTPWRVLGIHKRQFLLGRSFLSNEAAWKVSMPCDKWHDTWAPGAPKRIL